jgi:hypothetical protein
MNRPLLLQLLPEPLRLSAWYRLYAGKHGKHYKWLKLYEAASLTYAKEVRLQLLPGDHISDQIAFTGFYELSLTRRLIELSKQGGTMIDIGANLGYFSCLWAAGNAKNKCFAFEASPRNIGILHYFRLLQVLKQGALILRSALKNKLDGVVSRLLLVPRVLKLT